METCEYCGHVKNLPRFIRIDEKVREVECCFNRNAHLNHDRLLVYGEDKTGRKCITEEHSFNNLLAVLAHIELGGTVCANGNVYTKV